MEPLDSRNWKSARARGLGILHLAASVLLFFALTVSHSLASPYWLSTQHPTTLSSQGGHPLAVGAETPGSVSHTRNRAVENNSHPWHRASTPAHRDPSSPYLSPSAVRIDPSGDAGRTTPDAAAGLPGAPLLRAYDPQGPPSAA